MRGRGLVAPTAANWARRGRCAGRAGAGAVFLASWLLASSAHAADSQERDQCIGAAEQAQQLRDDGKYQLARDLFARCARDSCPVVVRQDCTLWLSDVDNKTPTVLVLARAERDRELANVVVMVDGSPLPFAIAGKPIPTPVDPGSHLFRFEAPGYAPIEEYVAIHAGEKNRVIGVHFGDRPPSRVPLVPAPSPLLLDTVTAHSRQPPLLPVMFGGVALAAFGSSLYFGISGLLERSADLAATGCAPHCLVSERDTIETKFVAADISLGVGIVSAGLATYFYLVSRKTPAVLGTAAVDLTPQQGGGVVRISGRF